MALRNKASRTKYRRALRDRDGDDCHICQGLMVFHNTENPDFATIDHIKPKSKGGKDVMANLKLAHRHCNERRKDGPVETGFPPC